MNFGSDNTTGASDEILAAVTAANGGKATPYGNDDLTLAVEKKVADIFERDASVFLVPTGTAANALSLATMTPDFGQVYCHPLSHIMTDECGAPEFFTGGAKLTPLPDRDGKITAADLAHALAEPDRDPHSVPPAAVSITQAAETGVVYTATEIKAIADTAQAKDLMVHMDGARFANAVATLGCTPADITWKAGIDILSFGATKNGALMAEAIVVFDAARAKTLAHRRKRAGHLTSKMRFMSAQFDAYLTDDHWLHNARHANAMAAKLARGLSAITGTRLAYAVEANELFVDMPTPLAEGLEQDGFSFYRWPSADVAEGQTRLRLVTSFATPEADVDRFIRSIQRHLESATGT